MFNFGKRYYLIIKFIGFQTIKQVWHCHRETALGMNPDFIIPLERKPRNVTILEGK